MCCDFLLLFGMVSSSCVVDGGADPVGGDAVSVHVGVIVAGVVVGCMIGMVVCIASVGDCGRGPGVLVVVVVGCVTSITDVFLRC